MSTTRQKAIEYAQGNRERYLAELKELLAIASISTDPASKGEMQTAAQWVAAKLKAIGAQNVEVIPTGGHPVVYGEELSAGPGAATMMVYGHYDVQPPEPLDLWESPPFEASQRGEDLYARGASDMKGQVMASINAIEAVKQQGDLGINIKFLIEGEEEIGSPNLEAFLETQRERLACDFALNPDGAILAPEQPSITYALRGLAYFELRVYGPDHDLHSGTYGGLVVNPANELARLIGGMHDSQGRITLPGFYDKVREMDAEERGELARLPRDEDWYLKQTGAPGLWGEAAYTPTERAGGRPTLDANGLLSGFTGEGSKTIIPRMAMAKLSTRLVPDQDPQDVEGQLIQYLEENANPAARWELINLAGGNPAISARDSRWTTSLAAAMETVWGKGPLFRREGGTVPVVADMQRLLGADSVLTGFGLPDDNLHAPNEKQHLPTWYRGIDTFIHFIYNLAQ